MSAPPLMVARNKENGRGQQLPIIKSRASEFATGKDPKPDIQYCQSEMSTSQQRILYSTKGRTTATSSRPSFKKKETLLGAPNMSILKPTHHLLTCKAGRKRPRCQQTKSIPKPIQKYEHYKRIPQATSMNHKIHHLSNKRQSSSSRLLLIPLLFLFSFLPNDCQAAVSCETDQDCETLLRPGSECINNVCTNPFQKGCLRNYLGEEAFPEYRTCNSEDFILDDPESGLFEYNTTHCTPSPLEYSEIRILSQNWESAMFSAWIIQIALSELFQVPATIESSGPGRQVNFYDPDLGFSYGLMGYDFEALRQGNALGGGTCPPEWRRRDDENYRSCAHVMPEVWSGQASTIADLTAEEILEPPEGTGVVGKLGWFIPKYLAQQDPSLAHWLGISGPLNRRRVAETFRVPTTFGMFCSEIVPHNCTEPTIYASRPPADAAEAEKFFVAGGVFSGYFRFTEDNDCDLNPDTCVGHITDVPCEWTTFATAQAYHLDVPVKSQGSLGGNKAYSYGQLLDIWAAANATKSAILLYWWYPDPTYQFYLGSDAEMQAVQLPPPRQICVTNRVGVEQRCSDNQTARVGVKEGACDSEPHSLVKVVVSNLYHYIQGRQPTEDMSLNQSAVEISFQTKRRNPALVSPAYDLIQAFSITELQHGEISDVWESRGLDKWSYDPHEAVCEWMVDNLETIRTWIPRSYPRKVQEEAYDHGLEGLYGFAVFLAVLVSVIVMVTTALTYHWRERPLLVFSQVNFLFFLLGGLEFVSIGSLLVALEPTDATCMLQNWFVLLGYTLELVPMIVKVGAIHRMMRAAKRMKRITLDQRHLHMTVVFFFVMVTIVLTTWTAIDPSKSHSEIVLHRNRQTDRGETIVTISNYCAASKNDDVWRYLSLCWQMVLLLCATVLAYQTRNIRKDLNESHTLGVMIYSHFVFLIFRVITFVLAGEDENGQPTVSRNILEGIRSLLLSLDVLVATCIYFAPKMYGLMKHDDEYFKAMMAMQRRQSVARSSINRSSLVSQASFNGLEAPQSAWQNSSFSAHMVVPSVAENKSSEVTSGVDSFDPKTKRLSLTRMSQGSLPSIASVSGFSSSTPGDVVGDIALSSSSGNLHHLAPVDEQTSVHMNATVDENKGKNTNHTNATADANSGDGAGESSDLRPSKPAQNGIGNSSTVAPASEKKSKDKECPQEAFPEQRTSKRKSDPSRSLQASANLHEDETELDPEAEAKARARMNRLEMESSRTKEMYLDYIGSSRESNLSEDKSRKASSRGKGIVDSAPDNRRRREPSISPERKSKSATVVSRSKPNTIVIENRPTGKNGITEKNGIRRRSASIDELRFEKLCSDDDKLDENHYFF